MTIRIAQHADRRIAVTSPYNAEWTRQAKDLAGRWSPDARAWVFPSEQLEAVRALLRAVYGQDDRPTATVRLRVTFLDAMDSGGRGEVVVAGRQIARAFGRDSGARLGEDVVVLAGGFGSGGSIKNWRITWRDGTVFDLLRLPEAMAHAMEDRYPEHCRIVPSDGVEDTATVEG